MDNSFKITKSQLVDALIYFMLTVLIIGFILSLDYSDSNWIVIILFFVIGIYSFIKIINSDANVDVRRNFYIFNFIFMFLAPLQQYTEHSRLWNSTGLNVIYEDLDYIRALVACALMIFMFEVGYRSKKFIPIKKTMYTDKKKALYLNNNICLILTAISSISFFFLLLTNSISQGNNVFGNSSLAVQLINIIKYFPVDCALMMLLHRQNYGIREKKIYLVIIVLEVAIIYAPMWGSMARFILFGTYIVFIAFFFHDFRYKSVYCAGLILGFCFAFTSVRHSTNPLAFLTSLKIDFMHVDFDSFQIFMAAQKYVDEKGSFYLRNIISALAFLIPRTIWHGKLEGSGALIVRFYGSWQENVSCPLIAEMYMSGGWFCIIVFSIIIGRMSYWIDSMRFSNNIKYAMFCLISGMTIYIFRGSLNVAIAFTGGLIISLYFIYLICLCKVK